MAKTRRHRKPAPEMSRQDVLRRRAARQARKGELRKAALSLREAVALEGTPQAWTRLGDMLRRAGRERDALQALRQALFLFRRDGMAGRARAVARLIVALDPADMKAARVAA